jgi:multiple sugar transport system substrate-binding protein
MEPEQRKALDESLVKLRAGRMTRRTFLERATSLGLSGSAAVSLLEACGGSSNSSGGNKAATNIIWQSEQESTNTYKAIVDTFNASVGQRKGIHVTWQQGPASTNDMLTRYTNMLRARDGSIDVLSIDIVYPAQFAASEWIRPITTQQWSNSERNAYLPGPLQGCTYQNKLWAAPFRSDVGVLYYRTDLINEAPGTWDDLTAQAQGVQHGQVKYGYVWQGAQYEGLVCNFCEVLYGYGGTVLDPNDPTKVTVNSDEGRAALARMVSWVGTISPRSVTTYMEDSSRQVWQNADAAFMRNWPYAYTLGEDSTQSRIVNKFAVHALCAGGKNSVPHSVLGGWNMAINAYSPHGEQAWEFIHYMLQQDAQKKAALGAGLAMTLKSIYTDKDVLAKNPLFSQLQAILQNALPRPVSPRYTNVSDALQLHIYQALKREHSPGDALASLATDLQKIVTTV